MTTDIGKIFPNKLSEKDLEIGGAKPIENTTFYSLLLGEYTGIYGPFFDGKPGENNKPKNYTLRSVLNPAGEMVNLDK